MVLGKLPVPGRPTNLEKVGQGPTGLGGVVWTFFSLIYLFSFLSPSLWETARYRLKYCLEGQLSPKQPTSVKTGLNDMKIKIKRTASLGSVVSFSELFLKI